MNIRVLLDREVSIATQWDSNSFERGTAAGWLAVHDQVQGRCFNWVPRVWLMRRSTDASAHP
jgi:hypothetical protein